VRIACVDTCGKAAHAGGSWSPQATLDRCRQRLLDGSYDPLRGRLRDYVVARITPRRGSRHIAAADRVSAGADVLQHRRAHPPG
jgi:hypothetical protein